MITCNDLLGLKSLKDLKLLGGNNGLNRIVSWPYIAIDQSISEWVYGGEFLIYVGVGNDISINSLSTLIKECNQKNLAGIVILITEDYIQKVDAQLIDLANNLNFPLFELPWQTHLLQVTKEITHLIIKNQNENSAYRNFWQGILMSADISQEIRISATGIGYNPNRFYACLILQINNLSSYTKEHNLNSEVKVSGFLELFFQRAQYAMNQSELKFWDIPRDENGIFIIEIPEKSTEQGLLDKYNQFAAQLRKYFKGLELCISAGRQYKSISNVKLSFHEAEKAILVSKYIYKTPDIVLYSKIGVYRVLFEVSTRSELIQYYEDTMMKILTYDSKNNSELEFTLTCYINNQFNIVKTAQDLFLHRNSVSARLQLIQTLSNKSLKKPQDILDFQVCSVIKNFLQLPY